MRDGGECCHCSRARWRDNTGTACVLPGRRPFFSDTLRLGDGIFRNEKVYTKRYGSIEILFDDETTLTVGPSSEIVIDDYVYSPSSSAGRAAITLVTGVLRIVSGRLPKESISVSAVVANIGVRGTDFTLDTNSFGSVKIWVDEGIVSATPVQGQTVFEFVAPVYAVCNVTSCEEGATPPKPISFPETPVDNQLDEDGGGDGGGH